MIWLITWPTIDIFFWYVGGENTLTNKWQFYLLTTNFWVLKLQNGSIRKRLWREHIYNQEKTYLKDLKISGGIRGEAVNGGAVAGGRLYLFSVRGGAGFNFVHKHCMWIVVQNHYSFLRNCFDMAGHMASHVVCGWRRLEEIISRKNYHFIC